MKIVICHPILPAPLRLTDNYNYCSVSVSVSVSVLYTEINDLLHICFSCWRPPQFVLQTWLELIPTKFIIWFPPLFQLELELTGWVCWTGQPYVVLFIWILLLSVGSNGDECWWNSSNGNFPNYVEITATMADVICNEKLSVFCF